VDKQTLADLRLAVNEACSNVVRHAYENDTGAMKVEARPIGDHLVVVVHDLIYRRKIHWPSVFLHTVVVAGYLIARSLVLGKAGQWSAVDLSQFSRVIDFALGYSEMLVLPAHIPFYIQPPEHAVSSVLGIISAIMIVMLVGFCWWTFDMGRRKDLAFSVVWTIGFFWPAILLAFYTDGFYAGRYLYVPSIGVAIFVSLFYDYMNAAYPRLKTSLMAFCALIIACYGFVTWKEIPAWHDGGTIYGKIAEVAPENAVGFMGLGLFHFNREEYAAAESNFLLADKWHFLRNIKKVCAYLTLVDNEKVFRH